ncbi:hypothetical protein NXC14_PA00524 (plasmid) [Rhizobium sp. NXC14]|nr:hypothetical protein NXC14_PA00524 [Rhizobium sp. NXC14]
MPRARCGLSYQVGLSMVSTAILPWQVIHKAIAAVVRLQDRSICHFGSLITEIKSSG